MRSIAAVKSRISTCSALRRGGRRAPPLTTFARTAPGDPPGRAPSFSGSASVARRAAGREERRAGRGGQRARRQGLAGAGRAAQRRALGPVRPAPAVALGIPAAGAALLELVLRFIDAGDVLERRLGVALDVDLG